MRYSDIHVQRVAVAVGAEREHVRDALAGGRYEADQAAATGQVSLAAAPGWTGPDLAAVAGGRALAGADRTVALHLHATIHDAGWDFWSPAAYVARELGVRGGMTTGVNAMSNSMIAGLELAASTLSAWPGPHRALLTAGDVFAPPRFDPWSADAGMVYGSAGSALLLGPDPGLAAVLATASAADPDLEGLNRGNQPEHTNATTRPPVQLRTRKRDWVRAHGGPREVARRNAACVRSATNTALAEAEAELDDLAAVFGPHYGRALLAEHVLAPLDLPVTRTAAEYGAHVGHLGASDQLAALQHWCATGRLQPGELVLLLGIGVGMTHTAAICRIEDPSAAHPIAAAPHTPPALAQAGSVAWEASA